MVQGVDQAVDLLIGRSRLLLDIVALAPVQQTTDAARPGVLADARAPGPSAVKRDVDTGSIELRGHAARERGQRGMPRVIGDGQRVVRPRALCAPCVAE